MTTPSAFKNVFISSLARICTLDFTRLYYVSVLGSPDKNWLYYSLFSLEQMSTARIVALDTAKLMIGIIRNVCYSAITYTQGTHTWYMNNDAADGCARAMPIGIWETDVAVCVVYLKETT